MTCDLNVFNYYNIVGLNENQVCLIEIYLKKDTKPLKQIQITTVKHID